MMNGSVFEQVNNIDRAVYRASKASAEAAPSMQPVHTGDWSRVTCDTQSLGQATILTHLHIHTERNEGIVALYGTKYKCGPPGT